MNSFHFKAWNIENLTQITTATFDSHSNKIFLNLKTHDYPNNPNLFIVAGYDIRLYDSDLKLHDNFSRYTKEESIKLMSLVGRDRVALVTNSDIEIYDLVKGQVVENSQQPYYGLKFVKKITNEYEDSILHLERLNELLFATGSSDGELVIWKSETLDKFHCVKLFEELHKNDSRLNYTSIIRFGLFKEVKFV